MIKRILPSSLKLKLNLTRRFVRSILNGQYFNYAKKRKANDDLRYSLELEQELKPNEAKKENLRIAIKRIEAIQINPNEIFSFWHIVGQPSASKGFVHSRSLVNGKLENSIGGGLCQLSGLIYHLGLLANLEILERYNHSVDIYTDETRFTPLGSDATVAYGHKDLKIRNNLDAPIRFNFSLTDKHLKIKLMHSSSIPTNLIEFTKNQVDDNTIEILTKINAEVVTKSIYKINAVTKPK
jgi:vancomycin resistance protein VanW